MTITSSEALTQIQSALVPILTTADFTTLRMWMIEERARREDQAAMETGQAQAVKQLREQGVVPAPVCPEPPAEVGEYPVWVDPGADITRAYLAGDRVQHEGRVWESRSKGLNRAVPGVDESWMDVTPDDNVPEGEDAPPAIEQ